jgi:cobalt-zinc-cadmium efflux system outer membrane protein
MLRFVLLAGLLGAPGAVLAGDSPPSAPQTALPELVREALARSPELGWARERVRAMRARVPQAGALPDPVLMSGVINEGRPVPFETLGTAEFSEVYLGFSQALPWPGKRGLREDVANEEAAAEEQGREVLRRRLIVQVAERYYELYAVRAARESVERNLALMDRLASVARERFAVGQGIQHDVLDADIELSRLEERRLLLEQREQVLGAAVARLVDRPEPIRFGSLPPLERTPLRALQELLADAEETAPALREHRQRVQAAAQRLELARKELMPDLGLELIYHGRGGKELDPFYTLGWTMTLPLYASRKQKQAIEEAAAELGAARSAAQGARAQVREEVTTAYLRVSSADRLLRVYDEGLLRQGRLALDSATAQYQVGRVDFQTLVLSWRRLLEDEIRYGEQLAGRESAAAQLALHVRHSPLVPAERPGEH